MKSESIKIDVVVDGKIFRKFALFDNLCRRRIWVLPVIFVSIMSAFALVCFAMRGSREQAVMLGYVLLAIGWGLPVVYALKFFQSVRTQIKAMGLERPRPVYSLRLEPDGVQVTSGGKSVKYESGGLFGAYRVKGCVYLYVEGNKAFLLPDGQAEGGADVWTLLLDMLPAEKLHGRLAGQAAQ